MDKTEKQIAINNFLLWIERKYGQDLEGIALQHKMDIDCFGKVKAENLLEERVKFFFEKKADIPSRVKTKQIATQ